MLPPASKSGCNQPPRGHSVQMLECSRHLAQAYGPTFLEYSLMCEYLILKKQQLSGVYVMPSSGSALKWFGVLFIRQGLYQGGVFRFTLYIPDNYPDGDCPILVFEPPIFHPLINPETGELDVKRNFQKWRRNVNFLWQVLLCARRAFYKIETQMPLNHEAAALYEYELEQYKLEVAKSIAFCEQKLYERPATEDKHAFHFLPWDENVRDCVAHKLILEKVQPEETEDSNPGSAGLSWVNPGSLQIFSKAVSR